MSPTICSDQTQSVEHFYAHLRNSRDDIQKAGTALAPAKNLWYNSFNVSPQV